MNLAKTTKNQSLPVSFLPGTLIPAIFSLVWTHALSGAVRTWADIPYAEVTGSALPLTLSGLFIAAVSSLHWRTPGRSLLFAEGAAVLSIGVIASLNRAALLPSLALLLVAPLTVGVVVLVRRHTPDGFLRTLGASRAWRAAWVTASVIAVLQMARLTTFASNPESDWFLTTSNPFYAKHECASAYVYAAELNARGEPDVYDPAHYPGLNPKAEPQTRVVGMTPEDPFQYPPPFLMLPRLALSMTQDYPAIRSVWLALNVTFSLGSVLLLSLWVGRFTRWRSLLLAPLMAVAFPVLHNFQYGQFHFAAVALGVMGMLALETKRRILGAALLAAAISAKVFPVFLLVPLLAQRRFADLARVTIFGALFAGLGWVTLGSTPYAAFFAHHLPRLSSGAAFAFGEAWPEVADLLIAGNQGVAGIVAKLQYLGVGSLDAAAPQVVNQLYVLMLLPLFWLSSKSVARLDRDKKASFWIGVLGLASLASAGAWADYVPLSGVWALVYLLPLYRDRPALRALLVTSGFLQVTLLGTVPLGPYASASWMVPLSLLSGMSLLFILGVAASAPLLGGALRTDEARARIARGKVIGAIPDGAIQ